jgi:ATP-dependent Lhr-like helicase
MQLVLHSPHGARVNRGLALALRKRFCRAFNQELQCAATDDAAVLSLGPGQSFPLAELVRFLPAHSIREILEQAVLATPLFMARWRWNANRALAVLRFSGRGRVPFAIQRMQAEDLLAAVFPEQTACQEHARYPIEIPDQPLVRQTLHDCLHEALDLDGVERLCQGLECGRIRLHALETVEPSPFSHEILNARPYAFLDDAPLEERRTRAVALRRVLPEHASDLTRLDPEAIARVRAEAAPRVRDAEELCEWLVDAVVLAERDLGPEACAFAGELTHSGRAARVTGPDAEPRLFAAERRAEVRALFPEHHESPALSLPAALAARSCSRDEALEAALAGHLLWVGPVTASELARRVGVPERDLPSALARLESRGRILRGQFALGPEAGAEQFCDRGLLARIDRYTIARLRRESEPVSAENFLRFLLRWQGVHPERRALAEADLLAALERLSGYEAPAAAWESDLLRVRCAEYDPAWLDTLCLSGAVSWGRLRPPASEHALRPSRSTPIALVPRADLGPLLQAAGELRAGAAARAPLRGPAARIFELLQQRGALFARDFAPLALLPLQVEEGLRELVARGLVSCDGFAPLRRLFSAPSRGARRRPGRKLAFAAGRPMAEGRWSCLHALAAELDVEARAEACAWRLLRRYGVVFRDLLAREWVPEGWREVHRALRRLEARGQVRGGRFVHGFIGEQFAMPEAISALREARREPVRGLEVRVSAADPLNLVGILTPGPRVASARARWLVLRDGLPVAVRERGGETALPSSVPGGFAQPREGGS